QIDGHGLEHDGHGADQARESQHPHVAELGPGSAPIGCRKDGQRLFLHTKIPPALCALLHKGGGKKSGRGYTCTTPAVAHRHAAAGCGMRTADLPVTSSCHNSPSVRHFGGGSPTRGSLLCEWIIQRHYRPPP